MVEDTKKVWYPENKRYCGVSIIITNSVGEYIDKGVCFWLMDLESSDRISIHASAWKTYYSTAEDEQLSIYDFDMM